MSDSSELNEEQTMSLGRLTRMTPIAGIAVLGLGVGLGVSACSPVTSSTAAPPAATKTAAGSVAASAPATSAPAATAPATSVATASTAPASAPATPAGPGANAAPVDADGKPFVMWDCEGKPLVEPASVVLACADGGNRLAAMHWTSWAPTDANGTGTEYLNDCTPNCATGKFLAYPIDISLTGSVLVGQNEPFGYTKITLTYTGARPTTHITVNGKTELTHPATWSMKLPVVQRPRPGAAGVNN
jgi:nucleoid-associated protein YgaU